MMLYGNKKQPKEIRTIDRSDLIYFTKRLRDFIMFYEKFILVTDESTVNKLTKLKKYLEILSSERYDLLINDTSIIYDDISKPIMNQAFLESILNDDELPF